MENLKNTIALANEEYVNGMPKILGAYNIDCASRFFQGVDNDLYPEVGQTMSWHYEFFSCKNMKMLRDRIYEEMGFAINDHQFEQVLNFVANRENPYKTLQEKNKDVVKLAREVMESQEQAVKKFHYLSLGANRFIQNKAYPQGNHCKNQQEVDCMYGAVPGGWTWYEK